MLLVYSLNPDFKMLQAQATLSRNTPQGVVNIWDELSLSSSGSIVEAN